MAYIAALGNTVAGFRVSELQLRQDTGAATSLSQRLSRQPSQGHLVSATGKTKGFTV
jgi:hypothetical protein